MTLSIIPDTIPLSLALLCENCSTVVNAHELRGEVCPACGCQGALLSLARILNPMPELGEITYIRCDATTGAL
jgi:hypothetical protein